MGAPAILTRRVPSPRRAGHPGARNVKVGGRLRDPEGSPAPRPPPNKGSASGGPGERLPGARAWRVLCMTHRGREGGKRGLSLGPQDKDTES